MFSLLRQKDGNLFGQIVRYVFSGGMAFVLDMGVMIALKELAGIREALAATAGNVAGLIFTYVLSVFWIFDKRKYSNWIVEFLIFALIGVGGAAITYLLMSVFVDFLGIYYIISKLVTVLIVAVYAFIAKKMLLFSKRDAES